MNEKRQFEKVQMLAPRWQFSLSAQEARLVLSALGGRLRDDQIADAKKLGDELTIARADWADQFANEMSKHADKVEDQS